MERFDRRQALMLSGGALASYVADGITGPSAAKKAGKRWFFQKPGTVKRWHSEKLFAFKVTLPMDAYPIGMDYGSRYGLQGSRMRSGFHSGVDIVAPVGTPIIAADTGVVEISTWDSEKGNTVRIKPHRLNQTSSKSEIPASLRELLDESPFVKTDYWYLNDRFVSAGDKVARGEVIATVGMTGARQTSPVPHLHFSTLSGGEADNPHFFWLGAPHDLRWLSSESRVVVEIPLFRPNQPEDDYATPPDSLQRLTYPLPSVNDVEYFRKIMRGMKKVR